MLAINRTVTCHYLLPCEKWSLVTNQPILHQLQLQSGTFLESDGVCSSQFSVHRLTIVVLDVHAIALHSGRSENGKHAM
jgi:hypothetical protein